nr:HD domain-containing protein [Gemmatimonadaceae bacterium]
HVRRVATYATILTSAADCDEDTQRMVERIALFHDIGKIHEALFDIIHDGEALSIAARRAIATHPRRGASVLEPLRGFYPELPEGVLCHHERWDGKGYPRRIKGRHIPFAARVVAIADTFDAVTYHRRYRDGRSAGDACEVIMRGRGTQFDPELVDLFLLPPVMAEIEHARRRVFKWSLPVQSRRTGREEDNIPEITFRWRPGRSVSRVRK